MVRLANTRFVLAVRCPKSHRAPHMVTLGKLTEFRIRTNTGTESMNTSQIRDAVPQTEGEAERAKFWCERQEVAIAEALGTKYWAVFYVPLRRGPRLLDLGNKMILERLGKVRVPGLQESQHYASSVFCFEGLRRLWSNSNSERVTVHRSGQVVFQGKFSIDGGHGDEFFPHATFEAGVRMAVEDVVALVRGSTLPWPGYIALVLAGVSGQSIAVGDHNFARHDHERAGWSHRFELNRIGLIETAIVHPAEEPDVLLRPLLDVVWNAANHPGCPGFDEAGKYAGYR